MKECAFGLVEKNPLCSVACLCTTQGKKKKETCNHGAFQGVFTGQEATRELGSCEQIVKKTDGIAD